MISNKNMDRVSLVCYATVSNMFAMFCNPKFRGSNFQWKNFPKMMSGHCRSQVFMANIRGKDQEEIFNHAEKTGFEIATNMIKEAGFCDE